MIWEVLKRAKRRTSETISPVEPESVCGLSVNHFAALHIWHFAVVTFWNILASATYSGFAHLTFLGEYSPTVG